MKKLGQPGGVSIDDAITDITRRESDELLSSEEAQLHDAFAPSKYSFKHRLGLFFKKWWLSKPARYGSLAGLVIAIFCAVLITPFRNGVLNTVGVRGSLIIVVTDKTNSAPLQNVQVEIAGKTQKTSRTGRVIITDLKLGSYELVMRKNAFAQARMQISVGAGETIIDAVPLRAVGAQYRINAVDYLTGKTILTARASSGKDANANADNTGKLVLTVKAESGESLVIVVSADDYKDTTIKIAVGSTMLQHVELVPKVRHVFASNTSGVLGIFSSDIDGKNRTEVFLTTADNQASTLQIRTATDNSRAAVVSKKDGITNNEGYSLDALSVIQLASNSVKTIERAESIRLLDWQGSILVYQLIANGVSAANPQRSKIMSYNTVTDKKTQLVAANYFVGFELVKDQVYYAISATDPSIQSSFMQIGIDGKNRQLLVKDIIWGIYRKSYTTIVLQGQSNGWTAYDTTIHKSSVLTSGDYANYSYAVSSNNKQVAHTDTRDGKNVIIVTDTIAKKDTVVPGVTNASQVRWLSNNILTYRVFSNKEIADYVISAAGGIPKKITDVVSTN